MTNELLDGLTLHHIGIVVGDLDVAADRYRRLGFGEPEWHDVPEQGVRVVSFQAGPGHLELMSPTVPDSGIARYLASRGDGIHHVAYGVPDLEGALRRLAGAGFELIDTVPRRGIHGWRVAFVHPRSCNGVLTELVEVGTPDAE